KEKTRTSRKALDNLKHSLQPEEDAEAVRENLEEDLSDEYEIEPGPITNGDYVKLKEQDAIGEVLSVHGKTALVAMGSLKSSIKLNRLTRLTRKEKRKHATGFIARTAMQGIDLIEKKSNFTTNLDLRGKRGEESLALIENFIDEASMFGAGEVRIIHGKGDGILRQITRDKLRQTSQVRSFQDEHVERGGAGVTVVKLK